jgi:hypothetical protein
MAKEVSKSSSGFVTKGAIGIVCLLLLLGVGYLVLPYFVSTAGGLIGLGSNKYSEGYRDVYLRKVTTKGVLKVYEIEAGFHGSTSFSSEKGATSGTWIANVEDAATLNDLAKIRGDELVRVHYQERYVRGIDTSSYVVVRVERLDTILPRDR